MDAAEQAKQIGDWKMARTLLRKALPRAPNSAALLLAIAKTERGLLNTAEARLLYLRANRQEPGGIDAYIGLATLAHNQGKQEEAWRWLSAGRKAALKGRSAADDFLALSQAYSAFNDNSGAESVLQQALQTTPADARLQLRLASLLLESNRLPKAVSLLQNILSVQPDDVRACRLLASCLTNPANDRPDFDTARILLEKTVRLNPRDSEAYKTLGFVYRHENLNRLALRAYDAAIRLDPDSLEARYAIGQLYVTVNRPDLGQPHLASCEAIRKREREMDQLYVRALRQPRQMDAHLALGKALEERGKYAGALWEYQICEELDGRNLKVRNTKQRLYRSLEWDVKTDT